MNLMYMIFLMTAQFLYRIDNQYYNHIDRVYMFSGTIKSIEIEIYDSFIIYVVFIFKFILKKWNNPYKSQNTWSFIILKVPIP